DGLNRYDGNEFRLHVPHNQIGQALPSNHVTSLQYDTHEDIMWIGTIQGMGLYSLKIDSIIPVSRIYPFASRLESTPIKNIFQFEKDRIWVITQLDGLILIDLRIMRLHRYFDKEGMRDQVNGLTMHMDQVVVSVMDRLYSLDSHTLASFESVGLNIDFSEIRALHSFQDQLWVGTSLNGCFVIEDFGQTNFINQFKELSYG